MSQASPGGVENQQRTALATDVGDPLIEVGRHPWRQAAARHHEVRGTCCDAKLFEALGLLGIGELRAREDESVLLAGPSLVHGEAFPGGVSHRDPLHRNPRVSNKIGHLIAGVAARRKERRY